MSTVREHAIFLVETLQARGYTAYWAGGCVRDQLRGEAPKDYDIVTDARPEEVQELFAQSQAVGAHFGVIIVRSGGFDYDVATFRSDGIYHDGRHPDNVTYSSPEEDALRRDFTINGIFYDPLVERYFDYVDGQSDLQRGCIRAIGEPSQRFHEDHLRLLRAIRFATTLGYTIEDNTWAALCSHAPEILTISAERIRDELVRIFLSPQRVRGFDLLVDSGLMEKIIPEITDLRGCEQPPAFHPEGDVFVHTRLMLELLPEKISLPLAFSVLLHDIGKPPTYTYDESADRIRFNGHDRVGARMARKVMRRLKFSNDITEATEVAVANHMIFKDVQQMRVAKLKRFMARPTFEDEMELHRVDCLGSHGALDNYQFLCDKQDEFASEPIIPPPLISGRDLLERGWTEGPSIGSVLEEIQTKQLEGELTSREEALEWVESRGKEKFSATKKHKNTPKKS